MQLLLTRWRLKVLALSEVHERMRQLQLLPAVAAEAASLLTCSQRQRLERKRALLVGERNRQLQLLALTVSMGLPGARRSSSWLQARLAAGAAAECQRALRQQPRLTAHLPLPHCITMLPSLLTLPLVEPGEVLAWTSVRSLACHRAVLAAAAEGGC